MFIYTIRLYIYIFIYTHVWCLKIMACWAPIIITFLPFRSIVCQYFGSRRTWKSSQALQPLLVVCLCSGVEPPVQLVISRIGLCLCFFKGIAFYLGFGDVWGPCQTPRSWVLVWCIWIWFVKLRSLLTLTQLSWHSCKLNSWFHGRRCGLRHVRRLRANLLHHLDLHPHPLRRLEQPDC